MPKTIVCDDCHRPFVWGDGPCGEKMPPPTQCARCIRDAIAEQNDRWLRPTWQAGSTAPR